MFGLEFLFSAALFALPAAAIPVLLHMLFRRKSPVVQFPTLRFLKTSLQHTAARRRIQRWVLLACRILLLALLIWAIAQPVKMIASTWLDSDKSLIAAIVVDTSYSMQLKRNESTLLEKANDTINDLLRDPLKNAKVVIFRSPADETPPQLQTTSKIQSEWTALKPEPALHPLSQRCAAAIEFLSTQQAGQKWLIILTDLQSREFPTPLSAMDEGRAILFDLHPEKPRSYGITNVRIKPSQPVAGRGSEIEVEVSGFSGDARATTIQISKTDSTKLLTLGPLMASFDTAGRTRFRAPLEKGLPPEKYLLLSATLPDDDLQWDNTRSLLVELPPKQSVTLIENPSLPNITRFVKLALNPLDPDRPWPLAVQSASDLTGKENAAVTLWSQWPTEDQLRRTTTFVRNGGTLAILLQPGLEQSFAKLPQAHQQLLLDLLPSTPIASTDGGSLGSGQFRPVPPSQIDPIIEDIADPSFRLDKLTIRRFVPFTPASDPNVSTLLFLSPAGSDRRTQSFGLYFRRKLGPGTIYTLATMPETRYINPAAHPAFPIQLVNSCLRPLDQRDTQNIEIGHPLTLSNPRFTQFDELELQTPTNERYRVKKLNNRFTFAKTSDPGLHLWRVPSQTEPLAIANITLPAQESDLIYRPAETVVTPGPNTLIVHSFADLQSTMAKLNEPEPRWTLPLALVLILLAVEALLGSARQTGRVGLAPPSLVQPSTTR
ncbi:MAG TPA: BatA domain-containing protein [Tepidisphaeraceae bacterium]|nr:BatA domain-containing protein [Tepidisphaeraceae bacterium]